MSAIIKRRTYSYLDNKNIGAVSTQPQGNSAMYSRNNSLATIQHQGSLSIGGGQNNNVNSSNQISLPQGLMAATMIAQSNHRKQQSNTSNSGVKNQYVINVTQDSSLMTVADANNQRKSLSILTSQQSQLKEIFRNKAQTPQHNMHSSSTSHFNAPYMKDNYFVKNPDSVNQSGNLSRSKINQNKFIAFTDSAQKRRQSSSIIGSHNQSDYITEQHQASQLNNRTNSSNILIKVMENKKQTLSHQNSQLSQSQIHHTVSKEQIRREKLQKSYIECLKKCDLVKQQDYQFETFKSLIHNFMVNDALIANIEVPGSSQFSNQDSDQNHYEGQYHQQTSIGEKVHTESSQGNGNGKSKSSNNLDSESLSNTTKANDQHFITALKQEAKQQQQQSYQFITKKPSSSSTTHQKIGAQEQSFIGTGSQEELKSKVQFRTENNIGIQTPMKNNQDPNKITINIINSSHDINIPHIPGSSRAIHCEQSMQQTNKEDTEISDQSQLKNKEDVLMLLMDFLNSMEIPFKEGMSTKYYPQQSFMQTFMKSLMEMSNKVCHYLMMKKEKVVSIFINSILNMIAQIFEKQYLYIKQEVKLKAEAQIQEVNDKFDYLTNKKIELEGKINQMYKEQDKMQIEFQKKILNMEEIKNQYLEQAEILKEQIEESRTKKYKDYQLERIQIQTKEVIKNCAQIEAEIIKRKEESKETIQGLAKMTAEHFSLIKNDPRRKSLLGNFGLGGINQSDLLLGMNSVNHSDNQQSFSEFNQITFATKYDKPESKAAILFTHPFQFYIQQDIQNYMYDKLVPKQSRLEMIKFLENFMEEVTVQKYGGNKISAPINFLQWILNRYSNFFVSSIKITEICFLIQNLVNSRKEIGIFFATIFGIMQDNMLSDSQFEYMISVRKMLKSSIPLLEKIDELNETDINNIIEDNIYIPSKIVLDVFQSVFKNHPQYTKLEEKLNLFLNTRKIQINQKAIQEQRKIINSKFGESSLTLIPNLMEKMKTENINDVIRSLENIFFKLDVKRLDKVNYLSFKKLMFNHYGVDTEDDSISEYFFPFTFGEWFNYPGFIQKVVKLHVPDSVNDKLICYYSAMNEICNLLLHNQNQSFHDFKNRMSNYLFNMESLNVFQFNTQIEKQIFYIRHINYFFKQRIYDFFKSYDNSKDDHLKYNTKRISPALLYQYLFRQNEFASMYSYYKQIGKVDDSNDEPIRKLYPQRVLLDNFNEFLEYNRHIYQFLQVQEKISIIQQINTPSETSITYIPPPKSKTSLQRQTTMSKIKAAKVSKFQSQNSNLSNKSLLSQQINRKSQFQQQQNISRQDTMFAKQDSIQLDRLERSDSKDSVVSLATPASAGKKSIFSGI